MKILQSCGSNSWGGLEMFTLRTSCELKESGHDITILCRKNSTLSEKAIEKGLPILPLYGSGFFAPALICRIARKISTGGFEVIHTHLSHDLWTLVPAIKFSHVKPKLFFTKHMGSGVSKRDIFHRFLYRNVDGIFAISNYVKESVLRSCPVKSDVIRVLHPGISLEKYGKELFNKAAVRKKFNISDDSIVVGMAGRMTPGKGHEEFLSAVNYLKDLIKGNITYLVIGNASYGEENYENKIRRLAGELNINDILHFTGFINNIPEMMAALDIFVFPSHEESFGFMLLEAMASQLPVIACRSAGVPDIVIDKVTGILVPPGDYKALAEAIKQLAENQDSRYELGKAGRKRVEKYFGINDIISQLLKYYRE